MKRDDRERLFLSVLPLVRMLCGRAARKYMMDVDELTQECCHRLWRSFSTFDARRAAITTFAGSRVRYFIIDLVRESIERSRLWQQRYFPDPLCSDEEGIDDDGGFEALLKPCSELQRQILTGLYREGLSLDELAERRGVTKQAIREVACRARRIIKAQLEKLSSGSSVSEA